MAINRKINYNRRNFPDVREGLFNYVKQYYPNELADFNDSSIGTTLIELMAASSDIINFQVDRHFQETQLENAQKVKSIRYIAKNMGFNIPGKRGSVSIVDFTFNIPVKGDTFDVDYLPVLRAGTSVTGAGKVFELLDDVDFANPLSNRGLPNRIIIPEINENEVVVSYKITKREIVFNGESKIFSFGVRQQDFKPFLQVRLPERNVIGIDQVIVLDGLGLPNPSIQTFYNDDFRFYEVDWLLQDRVFTTDYTGVSENNLKVGNWKLITKKFLKEFTPNGSCILTFGGGNADAELFNDFLSAANVSYNGLDNYIENTSLGEIPSIDSTIFIKYRIGGGTASNVGSNAITSTGNVILEITGPNESINNQVRRSLSVNNPLPALGGADELGVEQIRQLIKYNFAAQERCVTLKDYLLRVYKMPGKYGTPFKVTATKEGNKVNIFIIGLDENANLDNVSNTLLKENISEYMSEYRMVNDYVQIRDGRVINLSCNFELYIDDNFISREIANNTLTVIRDFFDINKLNMGDEIYLGNLIEKVNNVPGVLNIISYKFFNKVGGEYSLNETDMEYSNNTTREIKLVNNALYSSPDSMFEIKFPLKDISLSLKKRTQL